MKNITFLFYLFPFMLFSQQVVRGKIVDQESQFPMPGVHIKFIEGKFVKGTITDQAGLFKIEDVPLGRHQIRFTFIGYKPQIQTIVVNAGREVILNVAIEESTEILEEFEISANEERAVNNEMAIVSAQQFSIEETERYAGSRADPARMVSNFAGVQGADDSRNDIVVRGNSPLGVIYRVEGITIPNPNHFSIAGSSGGPVSILNNKFLGNSDFFSGAFPAEYGNSTAGVFDLKLRNGNNEKLEFTGQFGFLGTELLLEGPLSKKSAASFLGMYRYSTVSLFSLMGINIGTSAVPKYQDFAFKFNFPFKKGGNLSLWAMGGKSDIEILISNQKDTSEIDLYGENTKDQYFGTQMYVGGITYTKPLNENTFIKSTTSVSLDQQNSRHDTISRTIDSVGNFNVFSIDKYMAYQFKTVRASNATSLNKKINKHNTLKIGWVVDYSGFDFLDSVTTNSSLQAYRKRFNSTGYYMMAQPYLSWKHKFSDDLILTAGLSSLYMSLGGAFSPIEPRLGLKWSINDKTALSFGAGRHSQTQPLYARYYLLPGNEMPHNENIGFSYSNHLVLGFSHKINKNFGIKSELYYQDLTGIPVEASESAFSLTNAGGGFARVFPDTLENTGTGHNYGLEITIQKYFNKNWHALLTGCIYSSKYTPSDSVERNTSYNGLFAINFLAGREFKIKNNTLGLGIKITSAGGKRYGYVDNIASRDQGEVVFLNIGFNEFQFPNYFRADIKTTYKINKEKVTHEIGIDFVNILGTQNILSLSYAPTGDPNIDPIRENYQLGFLPIFYYRIEF